MYAATDPLSLKSYSVAGPTQTVTDLFGGQVSSGKAIFLRSDS